MRSIPPAYAALYALLVNAVVAVVRTPILRAARVPAGGDETAPADYELEGVPAVAD